MNDSCPTGTETGGMSRGAGLRRAGCDWWGVSIRRGAPSHGRSPNPVGHRYQSVEVLCWAQGACPALEPEPGLMSGSGARQPCGAVMPQRYQYDQIETAYNDAKAMGRALTEQGGFSLVGDKVHVDVASRAAKPRHRVPRGGRACRPRGDLPGWLLRAATERPATVLPGHVGPRRRATALHNEALGLHDAVLLPG